MLLTSFPFSKCYVSVSPPAALAFISDATSNAHSDRVLSLFSFFESSSRLSRTTAKKDCVETANKEGKHVLSVIQRRGHSVEHNCVGRGKSEGRIKEIGKLDNCASQYDSYSGGACTDGMQGRLTNNPIELGKFKACLQFRKGLTSHVDFLLENSTISTKNQAEPS